MMNCVKVSGKRKVINIVRAALAANLEKEVSR